MSMVATTAARQVCRAARSLLCLSLDFGAKPNDTYSNERSPTTVPGTFN